MVSPVPDERDTKRIKRFTHYGLAHQPVDLREGVAKAYTVVKEVKNKTYFTPLTVVVRNPASNKNVLMFPLTGNHRHSTDHL